MAGKDWFPAFMKRHPEISVRFPEGTSINRATAFNKIAVEKFFNNLEPFLAVDPSRIYNVDETEILTLQDFLRSWQNVVKQE